jgi:nucleoside-diphosphate-sugar epimerase
MEASEVTRGSFVPDDADVKGLVALTGATGFIGGALAKQLVSAGWRVNALVRGLPKARALQRPGVTVIQGDLSDAEALQSLLCGVTAVVHCAGAVRGIDDEDFVRVNVAGTERIAAVAARMNPPPLFVSLSSLAAREPHLSAYAASKLAGEAALARVAGAMPVTILRPPAVYGPGDREMLPLLLLMMRGIAPVLGPSHARFSMLYIDDLASAVEQSLLAGERGRGVFELHDGRVGGYTWDAVVEAASGVRGKPVRTFVLPRHLLHSLALVSRRWGRLTRRAPMLTPGKVRELTHPSWVCDNTEVSRALGWTPRIEFAEGLRRTLEHNRAVKRATPEARTGRTGSAKASPR